MASSENHDRKEKRACTAGNTADCVLVIIQADVQPDAFFWIYFNTLRMGLQGFFLGVLGVRFFRFLLTNEQMYDTVHIKEHLF